MPKLRIFICVLLLVVFVNIHSLADDCNPGTCSLNLIETYLATQSSGSKSDNGAKTERIYSNDDYSRNLTVTFTIPIKYGKGIVTASGTLFLGKYELKGSLYAETDDYITETITIPPRKWQRVRFWNVTDTVYYSAWEEGYYFCPQHYTYYRIAISNLPSYSELDTWTKREWDSGSL